MTKPPSPTTRTVVASGRISATPNLPEAAAWPSAISIASFPWRAPWKRTPMVSGMVANTAVSSRIKPNAASTPSRRPDAMIIVGRRAHRILPRHMLSAPRYPVQDRINQSATRNAGTCRRSLYRFSVPRRGSGLLVYSTSATRVTTTALTRRASHSTAPFRTLALPVNVTPPAISWMQPDPLAAPPV